MWPVFLLAVAAAPPLPKIAVMDVTLRGGVPATVGQVLSDDIVAEVRKRRQRSQVISAEEIRSMLSVVGEKQKLGCGGNKDVQCLAEIGGALGADQMVNGTIGRLGSTYVFSLKVVDVPHARVLTSASVNLETKEDDQLLSAAARLVAQIFPDVQRAPVPTSALEEPSSVTASAPAPEKHSHVPAILIGLAGVAAGAVAIVGLAQVLSYDSEANAVNSGNESPPLRYAQVTGAQQSAKVWQPLAIGLGVLGVAGLTTAVIVW